MEYCLNCILSILDDPLHLVFSLSKYLIILLLLFSFYNFFVRYRFRKDNRQGFNRNGKASVRLELFKNKRINPSVVSLIIRNTGSREVDLEAPVLIFSTWTRKRKFRILTVDFSDIYPIYLESGKASVVKIGLEQFYRFAPELKRSGGIRVEMNEVNGQKFRSGKIRLKWW